MEGNRDEAERCIQIAAQALRESKMERAEKFLKKAEKLYPSQKAKGMTDNLQKCTISSCSLRVFCIFRFIRKSISVSQRESRGSRINTKRRRYDTKKKGACITVA